MLQEIRKYFIFIRQTYEKTPWFQREEQPMSSFLRNVPNFFPTDIQEGHFIAVNFIHSIEENQTQVLIAEATPSAKENPNPSKIT